MTPTHAAEPKASAALAWISTIGGGAVLATVVSAAVWMTSVHRQLGSIDTTLRYFMESMNERKIQHESLLRSTGEYRQANDRRVGEVESRVSILEDRSLFRPREDSR